MTHKLARANVNAMHDESLRLWQKIIDFLARMAGSTIFLLLNLAVFTLWLSTGGIGHDFYPFQFLTMAVSLEAIVLSSLILISQNRQSDKDRLAAEADYHTNLAAKDEIEAILKHLDVQDHSIMEMETKLIAYLRQDVKASLVEIAEILKRSQEEQKLMYAFLKTMAAYPTKQRSR